MTSTAVIVPIQNERSSAILRISDREEVEDDHMHAVVDPIQEEDIEVFRRTQEATPEKLQHGVQVSENDLNCLLEHYRYLSTDSNAKPESVPSIHRNLRHPYHSASSTSNPAPVIMQRRARSTIHVPIQKLQRRASTSSLARSKCSHFPQRSARPHHHTRHNSVNLDVPLETTRYKPSLSCRSLQVGKHMDSLQKVGKTKSRLGSFLSKSSSSLAKVKSDDGSAISVNSTSAASLETRSVTSSMQSSISHAGQSLQRFKQLFRNPSFDHHSVPPIAPIIVLNGAAPLLENLDLSPPEEEEESKIPDKASRRPTESELEGMELKLQKILSKPTGEEMWNRREYFASSVQALRQCRPAPKLPKQLMKASRDSLTKEAKEFVVDLKLQMSHKLNDRSISPEILSQRLDDVETETETDIDEIHEENVLSVFQWSDASVADGLQRKFIAQNTLFKSAQRENALIYSILASGQDPIDDETLYEC